MTDYLVFGLDTEHFRLLLYLNLTTTNNGYIYFFSLIREMDFCSIMLHGSNTPYCWDLLNNKECNLLNVHTTKHPICTLHSTI